jgi:hypothetical protein
MPNRINRLLGVLELIWTLVVGDLPHHGRSMLCNPVGQVSDLPATFATASPQPALLTTTLVQHELQTDEIFLNFDRCESGLIQ